MTETPGKIDGGGPSAVTGIFYAAMFLVLLLMLAVAVGWGAHWTFRAWLWGWRQAG